MKVKDRPRFDIDTVRELAGAKVFARGKDYFADGHVEILILEPGRVLAQVAGTEDYRTEITGRGKTIDGECSCPAFGDWGFCKHMVAVALAANAAGDDAESAGSLARIRDHLRGKGVDALADMIVGLAERDAALFRKLDMAAAAARADDKTLEARLQKALDHAIRTNVYVDYYEASAWADDVGVALDAVADLVPNGRAALALRLVERAIDRIERCIESIDDSDGDCGALLHRAREIHVAAARMVRPDPLQLARELFTREMEDHYDDFDTITAYADVLGEEGLAEYRRLATEAWEKLPSRTGKTRNRDDSSDDKSYALSGILDFFAERDGDLDARIALRAKDLSTPWRYLQLAEFCFEHGREEEALRRAEEGLWVFEDDRTDERLVLFVAKLLSKAGRKADAEVQLWRAFEGAPRVELYKQLRKLGGKPAGERAVQILEAKSANGARIRWHSAASLLIEVLIREKMFEAAWVAVGRYQVSIEQRLTLARASESTHPGKVLAVYAERVDQLTNVGSNTAYEEAAKLIDRMASLQSTAERATYMAVLKTRHGRKRNFMKLIG